MELLGLLLRLRLILAKESSSRKKKGADSFDLTMQVSLWR